MTSEGDPSHAGNAAQVCSRRRNHGTGLFESESGVAIALVRRRRIYQRSVIDDFVLNESDADIRCLSLRVVREFLGGLSDKFHQVHEGFEVQLRHTCGHEFVLAHKIHQVFENVPDVEGVVLDLIDRSRMPTGKNESAVQAKCVAVGE